MLANQKKRSIWYFAPRVQLGPRLVPLAPLLRLLPRHRAQDVGPGPVPVLRPLRPPARRPLLWHLGGPGHGRTGHRGDARVGNKGEQWSRFGIAFNLFCGFRAFEKRVVFY